MTTTATETTRAQLEAVTVDAARLSWGTWDATKQKDIGEEQPPRHQTLAFQHRAREVWRGTEQLETQRRTPCTTAPPIHPKITNCA
jgi:hypothetical protein